MKAYAVPVDQRSKHQSSAVTVLWVIVHRLRRHWVVQNGWFLSGGKSSPVWRCITCQTERQAWAPRVLRWQERG